MNKEELENEVLKLKTELMESRTKHETLKKIAKSLYGTVLHVFVLAKEDPLVLIGPELYKEAAKGVKEYEDYEKN